MRLKFKHFLTYIHNPEERLDDSPLYIFDGSFAEKRGSRRMRRDYDLPYYFREDLMRFAGESRRPPYRCEADKRRSETLPRPLYKRCNLSASHYSCCIVDVVGVVRLQIRYLYHAHLHPIYVTTRTHFLSCW